MFPLELFTILLQSRPLPPDPQALQYLGVIGLFLFAPRAVFGPFIYWQARKDGSQREVWWGLFATLTPLIAGIAFIITRRPAPAPAVGPWNPWVACPWCKAPRGFSPMPCPSCGQYLPVPASAWTTPESEASGGAPPAAGPLPAENASKSREREIPTLQILGALGFALALSAISVNLLFTPVLIDTTIPIAAKEAATRAPWFALLGLIVLDSVFAAIAVDQSVFRGRLSWKEVGLSFTDAPFSIPQQLGLGVGAGALSFALSAVSLHALLEILRAFGYGAAATSAGAQPQLASLTDYGFWVAGTVALAPLGEEVFFRGYALGAFLKRGEPNRGLLATSILFAAVHQDPLAFAPLMAAGCILGALFIKTGSLLAPITAHATNNMIVMALTLFGV